MVLEAGIPWQEVVELADGLVGDALENVLEVELGVEAVELCRSEQGVDGGGTFTACVRSSEEIAASYLSFDGVERGDAFDGFACNR